MNMQKSRRFSLVTGVLFVLAIGLLQFSTIGGARAALNIESDTFKSAIHTQNLSVALSTDDVVGEFLGGAGEWQPGVTYQGDKGNASVSAINDGSITNEYVYDGAQFGIDILVDGVQTHHAHDAMLSAWGKNVSVTDDGPITAVN